MIPQIDLKRQHESLRAELMDAAARVLDSCRFVLGPEGQALERELADLCGARHGVGTGSGTDALLLALKAVGVRPGDEVITSAFSFVASATTIVMAGATPVYVDIEPDTFNLDPARVERAITSRTRAIVPVYLYGQVAAMDALGELARARGLVIVADAAQAVGASYAGRPVAAWADATALSFYPTKNLGACGDGGMVLTTRDDVAERVRLLRDHGAPRRYTHVELGGCSRLDELQAALLRVKLTPPGRVERAAPRDRPPLRHHARRPAARAAGGASRPRGTSTTSTRCGRPSGRRSRRPWPGWASAPRSTTRARSPGSRSSRSRARTATSRWPPRPPPRCCACRASPSSWIRRWTRWWTRSSGRSPR